MTGGPKYGGGQTGPHTPGAHGGPIPYGRQQGLHFGEHGYELVTQYGSGGRRPYWAGS
ncbi:MAG TPA: hypothetical protein VHX68_10740 [Planctomycetaceae bacterium]|nr:hypothetical protein [Planctomycetaceae bacterium]